MNKQDKEKSEQISKKYARQYHHNTYPERTNNSEYVFSNEECYHSAMEMAEWKEQQMIEYLYTNIQSLLKDYGVSEASADIVTQLFLANLKQNT